MVNFQLRPQWNIDRITASVLLAGGARGKRYSLPSSTIHMHPAPCGASGYVPDVEVQARELLRQQHVLREILAADTGQPIDCINRDFDRDLAAVLNW